MRTKKRRGIGTVIASAVMIFLMVFTIGQLYIYSIDELDNYNRVASQAFATQSQKLNEHLSIQSVTLDTSGTIGQDILTTAVISNTGGTTSQIVDVWFDEADTSPYTHTVVPQSGVYVGQGLSATVPSSGPGLDTGIPKSTVATIKMTIITALGNSVSTTLLPPGKAGTTAQTLATVSLTLVPPNPITSNDLVALLTVTNNNQLGAAFTNLKPDICISQPIATTAASCSYANDYGSVSETSTPSGWTPTSQICDVGGGYNTATPVGCAFLPGGHATPTSSSSGSVTCSPQPNPMSCTVTFAPALSCSPCTYVPSVYPSPGLTLATPAITNKLQNNFQVNFQSAAPSGSSFSWSMGPVVSPSSVQFLPYGSTAVFQWIFEVDTLTADSPITIQASYTNLATTNLFASQIASSTAIVRGSGGAASNVGGNLLTAFGSIVNVFPTFQYNAGCSGTWSVPSGIPRTTKPLLFTVGVINLGSTFIQLSSAAEVFVQKIGSSTTGDFYILGSPYPNPPSTCPLSSYTSPVVIPPSGVSVSLYFGATTPGGTTAQSLGGSAGDRWIVTVVITGYACPSAVTCTSTPYSQAITVLLVTAQ